MRVHASKKTNINTKHGKKNHRRVKWMKRLTAVDDVSSAGVLAPALPPLELPDARRVFVLRRGPKASPFGAPFGV